MNLNDCYNFNDFRELAKKNLPAPIFHYIDGAARAAEKFGTFYSMSTMATSSIEEIANVSSGPKMFQLYIHKDQGLTDNLIDRCKSAGFKSLCLNC